MVLGRKKSDTFGRECGIDSKIFVRIFSSLQGLKISMARECEPAC